MKKSTISKLSTAILMALLLLGCATTSGTKEASSAAEIPVITDIAIEDGNVVIKSNKDFTYTVYSANDPYKTTIEIPDMSIGAFTGRIVSDKSGLEIIPKQIDSPRKSARLDIMLQTPAAISPVYKDNTLALSIKKEQPVVWPAFKDKDITSKDIESRPDAAAYLTAAETPAYAVKAVDETAQPAAKATEIMGIELKKTKDAVKILITGNGAIIPNVFPLNEKIVVDIPDVVLKAALPENVIAPLKAIRAGKHKDKLRLVFDLKEKTNFDVAAIGNSVEISLQAREVQAAKTQEPAAAQTSLQNSAKAVPASSAASSKPVQSASVTEPLIEGEFTGKKISLDFQDADIIPIFRLLADVSGYNIVVDPAIKGAITLKLINVPWDQVLDIMLKTFSIGKTVDGNIIWIAPVTTFAKIAREKADKRLAEETAGELVEEAIRINYGSATEIRNAIGGGSGGGVDQRERGGGLLSPRGSASVDNRTNTLIVKDLPVNLAKIKALIKIMDIASPQVMIEAKIAQISSGYSEKLGITWGGSFTTTGPNTIDGNFSVNSPVAAAGSSTTNPGGAVGLTVGLANYFKLDMFLSALETIGKSKTLSNPKILALDNASANIQQGKTFYVQTLDDKGNPKSEEKTATLSLTVKPRITPDGYIQLEITATDDSLEISGQYPVVNKRSLQTTALVKNGETLVLGGIYTSNETELETGMPWLRKIPVLGWLFKTKTQTGPEIKEILVFITPTVVAQQK
ncbi:MAG: hypothetical protein CVV37_05035 [Nitrospira bacterium HGW-Nitrospira-1]|nr:MAG: hypothetical protein CVV37_05035 [Nitrospira bacterium HGW-Nitrospira-1]